MTKSSSEFYYAGFRRKRGKKRKRIYYSYDDEDNPLQSPAISSDEISSTTLRMDYEDNDDDKSSTKFFARTNEETNYLFDKLIENENNSVNNNNNRCLLKLCKFSCTFNCKSRTTNPFCSKACDTRNFPPNPRCFNNNVNNDNNNCSSKSFSIIKNVSSFCSSLVVGGGRISTKVPRAGYYSNSSLFFLQFCLISLLCLSCIFSFSFAEPPRNSLEETSSSKKGICPSLDLRNSPDSLNKLKDCRVIEGFLQIVLMDHTKESDFANLTYPKLHEITGYLLLYRVNGLRSLSKLFPNLSIIRGHHLFINYALAVYEMLHLQEIGLHSLIDIPRGAIFITKNPLLCYIDTIDWNRIATQGKDLNLIFDNRQSNACPKCPSFPNNPYCAISNITKQPLCWNGSHCQRSCSHCSSNRCSSSGECCSDYCLGGCKGPGSDKCVACKNVYLEDTKQCVVKCPDEYYKFKERRCIKRDECYAMPKPTDETSVMKMRPFPWKPFNGTCIYECPPGFEEVSYENQYVCERCKGACRKICDAANVDSIQSAQKLKGCVVINGSLEIQIRGGGNIIKELEESLNMIEEISGYLKVVRSLSLLSLNFLRKLQIIRGENLESQKYALIVIDNQNLVELWDFSRKEKPLSIYKGRIFFHFNPKLCLHKIRELQRIIHMEDVDVLEVAPNSNGDKVACNITNLQVSPAIIKHNSCILTWIPYSHYEMRTLLGYMIYMMEAPNRNVSMNDGHDACGGDGWKVYDVEVPENGSSNNITQIIPHLKPYTWYAYYIKTYTIASESNGAQSPIQYFRTNPSTPTPPRQLKVTAYSSSQLYVEWLPPEQSNGNLTNYVIFGEISDGHYLLEQRNYCAEPVEYEKKDTSLYKEDGKKKVLPSSPSSAVEKKVEECTCITNEPARIKKNDQEVRALIEFENKLHDSIYIKKNNTRQKREIPSYKDTMSTKSTSYYKDLQLFSNESSSGIQKKKDTNENFTTATTFRYVVPSTAQSIPITNLQHFTEYSIYVQACREKIVDDEMPSCSPDKMASAQTHPEETADKINPASIKVEIMNGTNDKGSVKLKWAEPNLTNGPILTYQIMYKRIDIENQQPTLECITHFEFMKNKTTYILRNLHAGNYSLTLRATSLARDGGNNYTPVTYFYIKEGNTTIVHQLFLGASVALFIVILIVVVLLAAVRYFYPDMWYQRKLLFATVNPEYFKPIDGYDQWEIPRRKVQFENLLGIGHFGEVYEGRAKGIIEKGVVTKVAIKTLSKSPNNHRSWANFINEASVMKQFDTAHVVRLLGVVTKGGEPLVIMELMARGDLRTYLRSCRADVSDKDSSSVAVLPPPTLPEILQMAAEIADGMLYLADKKFVHRDLAARNCMMNEAGIVKIGDFGLTRDIYETDYYRKDSKGHLPVRWMAPESLRDGVFTSRSDVWGYGVVLWEMATLASLPYTGLGNGEVMPFVMNGGVMDEPEDCPPIMAELMKSCWKFKYADRPSFSDIIQKLLPHLRKEFSEISYYHSDTATQLRSSSAETALDDDTPYTPLRKLENFEDFLLESDDDDNEENDVESEEHRLATTTDCSSTPPDIAFTTPMHNHDNDTNAASSPPHPMMNGFIRQPSHNLIQLNNIKTTTC